MHIKEVMAILVIWKVAKCWKRALGLFVQGFQTIKSIPDPLPKMFGKYGTMPKKIEISAYITRTPNTSKIVQLCILRKLWSFLFIEKLPNLAKRLLNSICIGFEQ